MEFRPISSEKWLIFFYNNWWEKIFKNSLEQDVLLENNCKSDKCILYHVLIVRFLLPYSDLKYDILRQTLTKTWDVAMNI